MNRIAVMDFETDPFEHGSMVYPFVVGFYDGHTYKHWWSENCAAEWVEWVLTQEEPLTIYAHNGGRFDFFFILDWIKHNLRIVNGRIIQAQLAHHELRDSFAIMPFALEKYHKTEIDYAKFKREVRENHREEICAYLKDDCIDLYTLCVNFVQEFGSALTIGSASMKQLKRFHDFKTGNKEYDTRFRKSFYFGGRNQVFQAGIVINDVRVYDVNSMYAFVMAKYRHPVSTGIYSSDRIEPNTAFITVEGWNSGAFPSRLKDGSLDFTQEYGVFNTTIHEWEAALDTGTFKPKRILKTMGFSEMHTFDDFVDHFYDARSKAKSEGDAIRTLFYKYVLNSGYGKFAQNPENYFDWYITSIGELPPDWHECDKACVDDCQLRWSPSFMSGNFIIWQKPIKEHFFYNIATGASITGASRAYLLRGLARADTPYYCDTDSIICRELQGVPLSDTELGAWKLEAYGSMAAFCGKKLYAIYDTEGKCIKKAHKGGKLTGDEILDIANGSEVEFANPVPTFRWDGTHTFQTRTFRSTNKTQKRKSNAFGNRQFNPANTGS